MSRYSLNPDRLFDRPWRPGHPFHPKTGRVRRIGMGVLFVTLCVIIWGYGYITDAKRVRTMAESYLSSLIGGRVTVGSATLSVFEGLRLDGVAVYVDLDDDPTLPPRPDGLVFSARTFIVQYDPRSMISGQLEAQQIVAEKPQVHLSRDVKTDRWNFNRLGQTNRPRPPAPPGPQPPPPKLPELLLRNARVELNELRDGRNQRLGYMSIDGQLNPQSATGGRRDDYTFSLQSRGISDEMGPRVTGRFNLSEGGISASLDHFVFGKDVSRMLPDDVSRLLERLDLKGQIDIPEMVYAPSQGGKAQSFKVKMKLNGVSFSVPSDQWAGSQEARHREDARRAAEIMARAYIGGGFGTRQPKPVAPVATEAGVTTEAGIPKALAWLAAESGEALVTNPAASLTSMLERPPVQFREVNGNFIFTEKGLEVEGLTGSVEGNPLTINGKVGGYGPEAILALHIGTADNKNLSIPAVPRYIWSLPPSIREFYEKTRPQGTCRLGLDINRQQEAGPIVVSGAVQLIDAQFLFDEFKYPIRKTRGWVKLARDPATGYDWLSLEGIVGNGVLEGPNREKELLVDGFIGPMNVPGKDPGGLLKIRGAGLTSEPALFRAFDNDVREALAIFDAPGKGQFPRFNADVYCEVFKTFGDTEPFRVRLDLDLKNAHAQMEGFPYPLRGVNGKVKVRDGYADVESLHLPVTGGTGTIAGRVAWKIPGRELPGELAKRKTNLAIDLAGMTIDEDLLAALPADASDWIRKMNVRGKLDVKGKLLGGEGGRPPNEADPEMPLTYDLDLTLRDAAIRPSEGTFEVAGVTGHLHLVPGQLDLLDVRGSHDKAAISTYGQIKWMAKKTRTALVATGENLTLDDDLRSILPPDAKIAWTEVQPRGTVNTEITFAGETDSDRSTGAASHAAATSPDVTFIDLSRPATLQATRPSALALELPASPGRPAVRREIPDGLNGVIRPRSLAITVKSLPYELHEVSGEVLISPEQVELRKISARHGQAELGISGTGKVGGDRPLWDLAVTAKKVPIDDDLVKALPASLQKGIRDLHATGTIGLDLEHLIYRGVPSAKGRPADSKPADDQSAKTELELSGKLLLENVGLDAGVTVKEAKGQIPLAVLVRGDELQTLAGSLDLASLDLAGRSVTDLRGQINKTADRRDIVFSKVRATVGGGDLAGAITFIPPDPGPATYKLSLFLRNADVRELTLDSKEGLSGRATASLDLEGTWGQTAIRRGRGDVSITGKEMYRIPLLLGMMQVTNLSLPITSPLSEATARYSVEGETVNFERIELRSQNMLMSGTGKLDFKTKQVQMVFVTDNPGGFKIPFLADLWRGAQQELVHIQVRGTVQDPKVENRPLGTFTTTVDQVFRGDAPKGKGKPKK